MRSYLSIAATVMMSACAVGPDYKSPAISVPNQWHESNVTSKPNLPDQWWKTFNDKELERLISEAVIANLDYKIALERVIDARAQRSITFASGLPSLSAKSSASRRFNNSAGTAQSGGATSGGGFGIGNQLINIFQMGFDAEWELDFFGGVRRALEAAEATIESEQENSRDVLVTLLGDVARNYIDLRANQLKMDITRKTLSAQHEIQNLVRIRQQSGLADMLDVAQAQSQADTTEAQIPGYEAQIDQSIHAISVLLGREPGALAIRLQNNSPVPKIDTTILADLPSELLKRRPDIRRAERQLALANASVGVATAELYPKINLAAFIGLQNMSIKDFTPIGKSWSTASTLTLPIFNWGKLNANIRSKKSQYEQAFLSYKSSVLNAFKEVEDALVAVRKEQVRYQSLEKAAEANRLAVTLAEERYEKGLTGFIDVLQSQQSLYQTETSLADSTAKVSSNQVALYKALGGGWQIEDQTNRIGLKK
ncbi:MAG: efflux transporter outer membrane subunit [Methylococcaceae bacterium]|nr:efflux transporter outer membrane subunit [Methylococcaceae bacterium]